MSRSEGRRARRRPSRSDPSEETAVWLAELEQLAERDQPADDEEWARTLRSKRSGLTGEHPAQPPPQPSPPPQPPDAAPSYLDQPPASTPDLGSPPAPHPEWAATPPPPAPAADPSFDWLNPPLSPVPPRPLGDPSNGYRGGGWDDWDQGAHAAAGSSAAPPVWPPSPDPEPDPWESGYGQAAYGDTGSMPAQAPLAPEPWQPGYQEPAWPPPANGGQFPAASGGTGHFPAVPAGPEPVAAPRPDPWEPPPAPVPEPEPWADATAAWAAPAPEPSREQGSRWPDDGLAADTGSWRPDPSRWSDQPWSPPPAAAPGPPPAYPPAGAAARPEMPLADSQPTMPVARLQPPPFAEPPVARRGAQRGAPAPDLDDEQVVALGGRSRPPQAPPRPVPSPPSWRNPTRPAAAFIDGEEDAGFGRYAGERARGTRARPAWPRIIALASWIVLLMVLCWFYIFPWLEHVLPANF